jgi:transcriptional regulator with XRE-family HTH domain
MDNGNPSGGVLRELRLQRGLSQEKLARRAHCSTSTVKLIEHGYRASNEMFERIARALDCDPSALGDP